MVGIADVFREVWTDAQWSRLIGESVSSFVFEDRAVALSWWRRVLRQVPARVVTVALRPRERSPRTEAAPFYVYGQFKVPAGAKPADVAVEMDVFAGDLAQEYAALHLK